MSDSGCPGCLYTSKGIAERLSVMRVEAKQKAVAESKPIAIYEDGGEFYLEDAFVAFQNNYSVKEVLSNV